MINRRQLLLTSTAFVASALAPIRVFAKENLGESYLVGATVVTDRPCMVSIIGGDSKTVYTLSSPLAMVPTYCDALYTRLPVIKGKPKLFTIPEANVDLRIDTISSKVYDMDALVSEMWRSKSYLLFHRMN